MICWTLLAANRVCTKESIRQRANSLVLRATQAALAAAKGTGYVVGHPAGRWCREALFFLGVELPAAGGGGEFVRVGGNCVLGELRQFASRRDRSMRSAPICWVPIDTGRRTRRRLPVAILAARANTERLFLRIVRATGNGESWLVPGSTAVGWGRRLRLSSRH